jgi:hypothetical protein
MTAIAAPAVAAMALVMSGAAQDASAAAPRAGRSCAWSIVPSPSPGSVRNILFGASGAAGGQVWAVGDRVSPERARLVAPIVERWNGSAWGVRVLPGNQSNLLGVFAPARADVWAVGIFIIELEDTLPIIDHFNGRTWRMVASPRIRFGVLSGVGGTSGRDIWATGRKLARRTVTVIEHYSGHGWTRVASPSPVTDYIDFGAIKALSPRDVWAAGDYVNAKGVFRTLIEHYNGRSWTIVPSPDIGRGDNYLSGIAALGPRNVWAVGRARVGSRFVPLAVHWNGHAWSARTLPAARSGDNMLNGVTSVAGSLWAVGSAVGARGVQRTLTERYADGRWRIVPSPNANRADNVLYAATVTGGRQVWAVGSGTSPTRGKTVTMRRCAG